MECEVLASHGLPVVVGEVVTIVRVLLILPFLLTGVWIPEEECAVEVKASSDALWDWR